MATLYDFALSFAGEDRTAAEILAEALRARNVSVFYDKYEQSSLLGKNLYEHLDDLYRNRAKFVVIFASKNYVKKNWTRHERRSAQARAFECDEYILPLRLDDTEIPGILRTTAYLRWNRSEVDLIADMLVSKLSLKPVDPGLRRRLTHSQIERGLLRSIVPFAAYLLGLEVLLQQRKIGYLTALLFGLAAVVLLARDLLRYVFGLRSRKLFIGLFAAWLVFLVGWAISFHVPWR